jgi:SAM-dependent methyltransferase
VKVGHAGGPAGSVRLRAADGPLLEGRRWVQPADEVDLRVLARCQGPVLDVGCGPGRHTVALAERGTSALGVDITDALLDVARPRGAAVLRRSVFDRLPGTGRWGTALLLDANLGIGGDLCALLGRLHELLRPGGLVLAEPTPGPDRGTARIEVGGAAGPWFPWVGVDEAALLGAVADGERFVVHDRWVDGGRTFVSLVHQPTP